ncbi:hypothetical protein C8R41DRAFT_498699 [Lentinula lateritia]|uniref:Uncharacterized protein n=1 Tax=Lentinula lateritia TaxID=40482 RepID=A0ABQ8V8C4_9AGAR|nr:hypothetical protein C8R41DRAFT_498699 [Lentinula lateritia]
MSLHHWRTPLYSHERAAPSRSSYVTAGEKPLFSILNTEDLEHRHCDGIEANDELWRSFRRDHSTESFNSDTYSSNSSFTLHDNPYKGESEEEVPSVGFKNASNLPSSAVISPTSSLHQVFEQTLESSMQSTLIDYPSGFFFSLDIGPEDGTMFMHDPFKFDYEHDKIPLSQDNLQMVNADSATSANSTTLHNSTAPDDSASLSLNRATSTVPDDSASFSLPSERGMSRAIRIQSSLDILRTGRISPVEFLTELLDVTNPRSAQFRGKLYSKTNKRVDDLLDKIVEDPMGEAMIEDWFRRYGSRKIRHPQFHAEKKTYFPAQGLETLSIIVVIDSDKEGWTIGGVDSTKCDLFRLL